MTDWAGGPHAQQLFDDLAERFDGVVSRGRMMGRPILLRADRRMVACLSHAVLGFRLAEGGEALRDALALDGAAPFSPGTRGTPFRNWAGLPIELADHWDRFLEDAIAER